MEKYEVMASNRTPIESFQVGDRVRYTGYSKPERGMITRVHVKRSDDAPDAFEIRRYDIKLDRGGNLIGMHAHIEPAL
jgi:hypothetical protein